MKKEKNYIDEWMTIREIKLYTKLSRLDMDKNNRT